MNKQKTKLEQSFNIVHKTWGVGVGWCNSRDNKSYEKSEIIWYMFFLSWQNSCLKLKDLCSKRKWTILNATRRCCWWWGCFILFYFFKQLSREETDSLKLLPWKLHSSHCETSLVGWAAEGLGYRGWTVVGILWFALGKHCILFLFIFMSPAPECFAKDVLCSYPGGKIGSTETFSGEKSHSWWDNGLFHMVKRLDEILIASDCWYQYFGSMQAFNNDSTVFQWFCNLFHYCFEITVASFKCCFRNASENWIIAVRAFWG